MPANKLTRDEVETILTRGVFHQWLGLRVLDLTDEALEIGATWREEFMVNAERRYTHGGILATLIDVAGDYAIAAKLGRAFPTVDLRVDYHRAAMPGDLRVRASVIKLGRTFTTAEAQVFDGEGKLLASGRGVYHTEQPG